MKHLLLYLTLALCVSGRAVAGPCTGTEGLLAAAEKQLVQNNLTNAEQLLAALNKDHWDCANVLLVRARLEADQEKAEQAEADFTRYLALIPDDSRGYAYFAELLISEGEYPRADTLSVTAIEKGPNDPVALTVRGKILIMKGQSGDALAILTRACTLDPEYAEAQLQLGSIYDRAKRPGSAVPHFQKAVTVNPADARAWDYLALNLEPLGEIDRADEAYRKGLQVNRNGPYFDAFLDYNYGRFLMKRNDLAASKASLDRAVELVPQMRATWYERAKLNLQLKSYKEARTDAEKAASLPDPDGLIIDLQLYALLEKIYRRMGETDLANKYAKLGRETPPPVRGMKH